MLKLQLILRYLPNKFHMKYAQSHIMKKPTFCKGIGMEVESKL